MRLVRYDRTPEDSPKSLLVGEAAPSGWATTAEQVRSFGEFYRRLHPQLVDFAERFLSRDDALDAVGDAIAALWPRWPSLAYEKKNDRYFFGAVAHSVRVFKRKNRLNVSLDDAQAEVDQQAARTSAAFDESDAEAKAALFDATVAAMPDRRREVFLLLRERTLTYKEAAQLLGLRYETIHTHIRLATEDLRAAFKRAGYRIATAKPRRLSAPKGDDTNV